MLLDWDLAFLASVWEVCVATGTRLGLPAGGWEARGQVSVVLSIAAFPATPAGAPDMWVSPASTRWKRDELAPLSLAQTAYRHSCTQINDCCFKAERFGVVCYTAKAMWYTDLLVTTIINPTWNVLFSYFPSCFMKRSAQRLVGKKQ